MLVAIGRAAFVRVAVPDCNEQRIMTIVRRGLILALGLLMPALLAAATAAAPLAMLAAAPAAPAAPAVPVDAVAPAAATAPATASASAATWRPEHIVIVVLENKTGGQVLGNKDMPYLNELAATGALMTNAYFAQTPYTGDSPAGLPARPSQPNYLYLLSGNNQGVLPPWMKGIGNDLIPAAMRPFATPNLGAALIAGGFSYTGFSESLPHPHYDAPGDMSLLKDEYRRKHNPTINWVNLTGATVPADKARYVLPVATNLAFTSTRDPVDGKSYRGFVMDEAGRALGYDQLPTVSLVVPNEQNDAHSGTNKACDAWLVANIKPYADWARAHNSLLVVTYDEDGSTNTSRGDGYRTGIDRIATIFYGPPERVVGGKYPETIDHLNVLATLLDRYGLLVQFKTDFAASYNTAEALIEAANLRPLKDVFGEGAALAEQTAK